MYFGAYQQDVLVHPGFDELIGYRKAIDEARALVADVERAAGAMGNAQLALQQYAAAGEVVVRAQGGKDDEVDIFLGNAGSLDGDGSGFCGEGRRRFLVLFGIPAFLNPCAFDNPLVGCVHQLG